eukprot:gene25935-31140_t
MLNFCQVECSGTLSLRRTETMRDIFIQSPAGVLLVRMTAMKIVLTIVALLLIIMGTVWALQGLSILGGSFMVGQTRWLYIEFETHEGREEEFITLIREHARKTLDEEPGCLRFEVIKPIARDGTPIANKVMVNELYANEVAVTAHENNPRMAKVRAANAPLLKSSRLILAKSLSPKPADGMTTMELNASNDD